MVMPEWRSSNPGSWSELFHAWLIRLSHDRLGLDQRSQSDESFTFGDPAGRHFSIKMTLESVTLLGASGIDEVAVEEVIRSAEAKTNRGDFGDVVAYSATLRTSIVSEANWHLHLMRTLASQVHIEGSRRLSNLVVLDFELVASVSSDSLFAPELTIQALIYAPGPAWSPLTDRFAAGIVETAAALCAIALGRPVDFESPDFPIEDDQVDEALARRNDPEIGGLARDGVSLDIFGDLQMLGGEQATLRAQSSVLALHAAMSQSSPDVALLLLVTSIEALIAPTPEWGKEKVVGRFVKSVVELCPDVLDQTLSHGNVQDAFGFVARGQANRQRREFLELIYASRSRITHAGLSVSPQGIAVMASQGSLRIALTTDLALGAFIGYLRAPRSSVVGYPPLQRDP